MGWKGTLRSMAAASRRIERENQRRRKAALKQQITNEAADAVEDWEDFVKRLVTLHTKLTPTLNWRQIAATPKPTEPVSQNTKETIARTALNNFKPGFFDFLFGGSDNKCQKLETSLKKAKEKDQNAFTKNHTIYVKELEKWENDTQLARRVMNREDKAFIEVIQKAESFGKETLLGSVVGFSIENGRIHAKPEIHPDDIVPNFRRKQLASGKLSETKMPTGQFNELYQDYVCSVALKVAGDLFNILPIDEVYVTCCASMLNSSSGHQEMTPLLSVQFVRETFERLNLVNIDPSDCMSNFKHTMSFKKTKGFAAIEPITQSF